MYCSLISLHSLGVFDGLHVIDQIDHANHRITLRARLIGSSAPCPGCQAESRRVHGHYWRCLGDLPCFGRPVILFVHIRRFRCGNDACSRRTFGERLPEIARPRARHTDRLRSVHHAIALAQSGNPGAHLATRIGMPVGATTLLRRLREVAPEPPLPPRVLGVDDWAWRKGSHYGTILYDLERRRRIDLLPDRKGDTLAAWLKEHPGVEIVVRDRAGAYACGARQGAPSAIQVADRWHLLRNGGDALRGVLDQHHRYLDQAAQIAAASVTVESAANDNAPATEGGHSAEPPVTKAERRSRDARQRREARFEEAVRLREQGLTMRGFTGQSGVGRQWAAGRRRQDPAADRAAPAQPPKAQPPTPRKAARLLMSEPDKLSADDRRFVTALLERSPPIARAVDLAKAFSTMIKEGLADRLDDWISAAEKDGFKGFAGSLRQDRDAVHAALTMPWSTGPVEGQINRLKVIKRSMYGRAGFDLLRRRVLAAP